MIDKKDRKILSLVQQDSRQSIQELAEQVNLSTSACHRRIRQLEEQGIIRGYVAQLDGKKVGSLIEFFVEVSLSSQKQDVLEEFERAVRLVPSVLECHLMSGQADYLLRVGAADTTQYERVYRKEIAQLPGVSRIQSSLVLRTVIQWSGYVVEEN